MSLASRPRLKKLSRLLSSPMRRGVGRRRMCRPQPGRSGRPCWGKFRMSENPHGCGQMNGFVSRGRYSIKLAILRICGFFSTYKKAVILSGATSARSALLAQSKDPYAAYPFTLVVAAILLVSLLSCSAHPDPNTLVMIIESSPTNLDPRVGLDAQSERIDELLFDALLTRDEHLNVQPGLAEK